MNEKKKKLKAVSTRKVLFMFLAVMGLFLMTACSKDEKEQNLREVLEQVYNCPDEELIALTNEPVTVNGIPDGGTGVASIEESPFLDRLEELYKPYFTEDAYLSFISNRISYDYHLDALENQYTLKVDSIDITKNKTDKTKYEFTVHIKYVSETGEEKKIDIQGTSQFSEDGKINYIKLFSDVIKKINE